MNPLYQYWRRQNARITAQDWKQFTDWDDFYKHLYQLKKAGVPIDQNAMGCCLKCTCKIVGGETVSEGCYVHSEKLKV